MIGLFKLPAFCALLFMAVIALAEGAAMMLAASPDSDFLWYLNLAIFKALRPGLSALSEAMGGGSRLVIAACAGAALATTALCAEARLLGAILSNLVLALCAAFWAIWRHDYLATRRFAADALSLLLDPVYGGPLLAVLLAVTAAGALASHAQYLAPLWRRA